MPSRCCGFAAVAPGGRRYRSISPARLAHGRKIAAYSGRYMGQTDGQTDGRTDAVPLYRPSAYYARGVNKRLLTAKNGRRRSSSRFQSLTCVPICTPGKPAKCHRYIAAYRTTEISRYPVLACTPREGPVNTVKSFNA